MRVRRSGPPRWRTASAVLAAAVLAGLGTAGPGFADDLPAPTPAPTDVAVTPTGPTRATVAVVTWTVPEGVPAGTTARVRYVASEGDMLQPHAVESDVPGRAEIPMDVEAVYSSIEVALVSPEDGPGPSVTLADRIQADRTAPAAPLAVRQEDGRIQWDDDPLDRSTPIVRAHWRYCRGWHVPGAVPCVEGSSTERPFPFSPSVLPLGPYPGGCTGNSDAFSLWLEDAAGNVSRDNAAGFGSSVSPSCIPPQQPDPGPRAPGPRPTSLKLAGRTTAVRGASGRHRVTVTASVPRDAAGRVALRVTRRGSGPRFTRTATAQVRDGRARATFTVPRGVRRLRVRATFAATPAYAAASRTVTIRVGG